MIEECIHGGVKRQCRICELETELEAERKLSDELAEALKETDRKLSQTPHIPPEQDILEIRDIGFKALAKHKALRGK